MCGLICRVHGVCQGVRRLRANSDGVDWADLWERLLTCTYTAREQRTGSAAEEVYLDETRDRPPDMYVLARCIRLQVGRGDSSLLGVVRRLLEEHSLTE